MTYRVGDKLKVVAMNCTHDFQVNSIIEVLLVDITGNQYLCKIGTLMGWITELDVIKA